MMEATAAERLVPLLLVCPECNGEQRGTSLRRCVLVEMLEHDEDVRVLIPSCGHIRSLTTLEKKNLKKALAEGVV